MSKVYAAVKALIEDNGKFLVIEQEVNGERRCDLPGGKVEYGETPYDTLTREVKEEVSLEIDIIKPIGVWWFFRDSDEAQIICNTFLCKPKHLNTNLNNNPASEKITNYYWLEKEEILKLENMPHDSLRKLIESI